VKAGGAQGLLLAPDAPHFADPGVRVQLGQVWKSALWGRWVAGNRWRIVISGVDAAGGTNQGAGAGGGLCLGVWQSVLWYQGRSRVVSEWY
jgi:hypothetical protein